ncbi:hypothetical protein J5N97_005329 [Dioscorea zingiberensis]|uniref:Hapless 8 n=1 Tax=Dioscorea zingiberensis TaxID=325984 RepID=A0A9D5HS36_9LILI|nr:hypothetical protein J5N97_005329 [Dioscorea zingiberensis]
MLSVENPPDTQPCPCKPSAVKSDEASDPVTLGGIQTPNFSIRGYVLASRSKNIATNWPFPQHCLQRCLKHGIQNLLPPFEPPGSVKARCCVTGVVQPEELENGDVPLNEVPRYIKPESCSPSDKLAVRHSDQAQHQTLEEGNSVVNNDVLVDEVKHCDFANTDSNSAENIELCGLLHVSKGDSDTSSVLEVVEPPSLSRRQESSEKKCKLIVRLGSISAISRAEDIVSTSSAVSDSMASKVCPVCKVFASTSNTTLNAHIDQCLSSDTNTNNVDTNLSKIKAKPRKKRLMVDIYTTAPHCTLKDLDRRNGTTWASDLAVVALTSEVRMEVKRPKIPQLDIKDDENDGAVYVDSNGIKLRILSKFNDAPAVMPKENLKLRKHGKEFKAGKSYLIGKKKRLGPKYMKMKSAFKKQCSFKISKGQIPATPEEDCQEDNHQENEESLSQKSDSEDNVNGNESSSLRQWACLKRSDLSKKLGSRETDGITEILGPNASSSLVDSDHPELVCSYAVQSHVVKCSSLCDASSSAPKTRIMDILANTDNVTENGKTDSPTQTVMRPKWSSDSSSSASGLMLKLSRSAGMLVSSPRSKREEVCRSSSAKMNNLPDLTMRGPKSGHLLMTSRKCSSLNNNIPFRRPVFSSGANKVDEREKHSILRKLRKRRSMVGTSKHGGRSPIDVNEGHCASLHNDASVSVRTNQTTQIHQIKFSDDSTWSEQGVERSTKEKGKSKALVLVDSINSVEEIVGEPVSRTMNLDDFNPASSAELEREPSCEEPPQFTLGSEAPLEAVEQKTLGDEQDRRIQDKTSNEEEYCSDQSNNCQVDATSIQGSSACLCSHEDMGHEIPQENSSITSNRVMSSDTDDLAIDREPSGSPVSTASTISPSSPIGSKVNDFVVEPLASPVRNKLSLQQSNTLTMPPISTIEGDEGTKVERRNHEVGVVASAKELAQLSDGQPCCCSRRENLPREPQFSRHSNLHIRPIIPSFGPCLTSDRPVVDSPTGSLSTMASSDSAARFMNFNDYNSRSPTQSAYKPVLRLMGKNLTVASKEEPVLLPSPVSDNASTPKCLSPLGYASSTGIMYPESFSYHNPYHHHQQQQHFIGSPVVFSQAAPVVAHQIPLHSYGMQIGGFARAPALYYSTAKLDQQTAQKHFSTKTDTSQDPNRMREVIVIDDSPDHEPVPRSSSLLNPASTSAPDIPALRPFSQRSFPCFLPSHSQFIPKELYGSFRPSFGVSSPRMSAIALPRGSALPGSGPLLPRPFQFQTPAMRPPMFYPETMR